MKLAMEKADIETVTSEEYKELIKKLDDKDKELEAIKKHFNHYKKESLK